jgi:hypothetical protein
MAKTTKAIRSFPLRLSLTMRRQVDALAIQEGISVNLFISLAVAEKITRLERDFLSDGTKTTADPLRTSIRFDSSEH